MKRSEKGLERSQIDSIVGRKFTLYVANRSLIQAPLGVIPKARVLPNVAQNLKIKQWVKVLTFLAVADPISSITYSHQGTTRTYP